jgi:hypothetical protein
MLTPLFLLLSAQITLGFELFKRDAHDVNLIARATSDPCCKSCGPIAEIISECPLETSDVFCDCERGWVKAAPTCQTCIANVNFNTSFAAAPGPLLETFWALCQCQWHCREVAEAVFAPQPCKGGTDEICVTSALVKYGPECNKCLKKTDEWFSSYFEIFVEQAKEFLETNKSAIPGHCSEAYADPRAMLGRRIVNSCFRCKWFSN